ncbi:MAG TPA: Rieske 2Fe-2S domain-containing protein [Candidatus Limnocylindrales bacterium]|nr:Rieske 2Fe-2S domain-containing protein [Candidatus Limnocylindrales bacterium]
MRQVRSPREWLVAALFAITGLIGLALLVVYVLGGQTQVEGILLAIALGSLGIGIVIWAQDLMTTPVVVEERQPFASDPAERLELEDSVKEEAGFTRRRLLVGMLLTAFAGLAAALAVPALSLGPAPGRELFTTSWRPGRRLVDESGTPIRAGDIPLDSLVTVFPEGAVGSADSQTLLIRVPPELLHLDPSRAAGAPQGYVAYSKICTHAGCPVGLYRATERKLICPCHQSTFDVLNGAIPIFGPAARALPQLPIRLQPDGTFVAIDDYAAPVGPSFWNMTS